VGQFFAGSNLNAPASQTATSTASGAINSIPTQVIAYVAMAQSTSTSVEKGSCFGSSVAAPYRSDAYRCTVGNAINDPCFVIPAGATNQISGSNITPSKTSLPDLLCGVNPASTDAAATFVLQLTKALPASEVSSKKPSNWAWLVELANGTVCSPFTGTRPFSATGEVGTYACNGGATGGSMIFGDLNNASATWTAEVGSLSTATSTFPPVVVSSATVPVAYVWQ
jgi:hypothetical protein